MVSKENAHAETKIQDKHARKGFEKYFDFECGDDASCRKDLVKEMTKDLSQKYYESQWQNHVPDMFMGLGIGIIVALMLVFLIKKCKGKKLSGLSKM